MHYGFLDMHSGYLKHALHTENEINELSGDAEECTKEERTARRIKHENDKFDEEHYM
jgi:protein SHQ1